MSVKRLERFSLNALLITRLKTTQLEIGKEKINLSSLINEVLEKEKDKFISRNIQIIFTDETKDGIILGEAELVTKCIENIIDNAVHFSSQNGKIEIKNYVEGQNTICEIKDTGKGFETGASGPKFELFTPGDEYNDNRIGMGLPITKMIMDAHGGRIAIGNNPEGGKALVSKKCSGLNDFVVDSNFFIQAHRVSYPLDDTYLTRISANI